MTDTTPNRKRLPPTATTTRELYLYSGNQCAEPTCSKPLLKVNGTWNCEVVHIYGVKPAAARGAHSLTDEELRDVSNLMLLCPEHHKDIDNPALQDVYTVDFVRQMKEKHELSYREAIAALERIVDTSAGAKVTYATNLRALEGASDEGILEMNLSEMKKFADSIAKQPPGIRDLLVLVLVHGELRSGYGSGLHPGVSVPVTQIEGVAQINQPEISRRVRHLQEAGLLAAFEDDGFYVISLTHPAARESGWDIFADLKKLAGGDRTIIQRAILELDFTVFDV